MFKTIVAFASRSITRIISSSSKASTGGSAPLRDLHSSSPIRDMGASTGDEEIWAQRYLDALCKQRVMRSQLAAKKKTGNQDGSSKPPSSSPSPILSWNQTSAPPSSSSASQSVTSGNKKPSPDTALKKSKPSGDRKIPDQDGLKT